MGKSSRLRSNLIHPCADNWPVLSTDTFYCRHTCLTFVPIVLFPGHFLITDIKISRALMG